jgi:SOS-response transcriptional repressor LexA
MNALNKQQQAALEFIVLFQNNNGKGPTVREIAQAAGIKAMSQIMAVLDELESRQYIWRDPGRRRGIKAIRLPNYCKCPTCGALMEKTENVSKAGAI